MPVYALTDELIFPNPELANDIGLLAVGGDLSIKRLLLAYSHGIFPWYSKDDPIMWWSPDPRMVLFPEKLKISKSLRQTLKNKNYEVRFDSNFEEVIENCSKTMRKGQDGTWITEEMKNAYIQLHESGYAHSVETYINGKLAGGLYGISLGRAFFGESMFYKESGASKIAFCFLVERAKEWDFHFIDTQVETQHLKSLGAINISRKEFLPLLNKTLNYPTIKGKW
ncbi:MAG: leucyl/phenylalanyl-tRNA--protein transferase [Bacteroidales bacterium]|nr:leucyl/phenylalanyl-tRNA--protein transferase [Bacteroidales bacterium]